jgi:dolichol-phosphate mannosyltransferase
MPRAEPPVFVDKHGRKGHPIRIDCVMRKQMKEFQAMIQNRALTPAATTTDVHENSTSERAAQALAIHVMLPAFNEADALPQMFDELDQTFRQHGWKYQVTVVDDGSTDDTAKLVRRASQSMPVSLISHSRNLGLAAAMRTGLSSVVRDANPRDIIVTMDSDNTHPIGLLPRMIEQVYAGHDVVVASRFCRQSRVMGVSLTRRMTAITAALLFNVIFPIRGIRDYTCGYRVYRAETIRNAFKSYGDKFVSEEGFSCMVDILLKLSRLNMIFGEVPMILRYDKKVGDSKMPVGKTISATLRLAARRRLGILD